MWDMFSHCDPGLFDDIWVHRAFDRVISCSCFCRMGEFFLRACLLACLLASHFTGREAVLLIFLKKRFVAVSLPIATQSWKFTSPLSFLPFAFHVTKPTSHQAWYTQHAFFTSRQQIFLSSRPILSLFSSFLSSSSFPPTLLFSSPAPTHSCGRCRIRWRKVG